MTTIAANRREMAADTCVSSDSDSECPWYPATKIVRTPTGIAGAAGDANNCLLFLDWASVGFEPGRKPKFSNNEFMTLVLEPSGLFTFDPDAPRMERITADYFAIGSGSGAARVAMKLGKDPLVAVRMAADVDPWTRGPFHRLKLRK